MAHIKRAVASDGTTRYRVRFRINGRAAERWFTREKEAQAYKTRVEAEALDGVLVDPRAGARTLDDDFATWLDSRLVKGRTLTPATRVGYQRLYRRNISSRIGGRQLRTLRPDTIRTWHAEVTTASSADQAAKSYRLLRAILAIAEDDEVIRVNPCRMRGAGEESAAERPMVPTSLALQLAEAIDHRYRALVLLAAFAGLRTGESLGLHRSNVDLLHGEVHVIQQAQEVPGAGRVELPPKSAAGRRVVALPSLLLEALEEHLNTYGPSEAAAPLFTGPGGGPLRRATLSKAWQAAVRATGAPEGLRSHDLRHHAATLTARMPGVTTKELMSRIGHASPRAALIYQHATQERDRAIASYLDGVVAGTERAPRADVVRLARGAVAGLAEGDATPSTAS